MNENLSRIIDLRVEKTLKNLEKNNMKGYYVKTNEELISLIDSLIENDRLITSGGSMTLSETGVIAHLNDKYAGAFADRASCTTPEETQECFRKAFISDSYFMSSNAITEEGELYNVDGQGNRVSAMIFGPKQVIVVAGTNKIVPDMKAAETRLEKLAAPANTVRLNMNTPCAVKGECCHCHGTDRICCTYVRSGQQRVKDRIKVIFIEGDYGF